MDHHLQILQSQLRTKMILILHLLPPPMICLMCNVFNLPTLSNSACWNEVTHDSVSVTEAKESRFHTAARKEEPCSAASQKTSVPTHYPVPVSSRPDVFRIPPLPGFSPFSPNCSRCTGRLKPPLRSCVLLLPSPHSPGLSRSCQYRLHYFGPVARWLTP